MVRLSVCIFIYCVCLIPVCQIYSFMLCYATIYDGEIKLYILLSAILPRDAMLTLYTGYGPVFHESELYKIIHYVVRKLGYLQK